MPKPKYTAWSKEQEKTIRKVRVVKGYESLNSFVAALKEHGVDMSANAWLRRERGETPIMIPELVAFADVCGLSIDNAARLFSRPEYGMKHSEVTFDLTFAQ